MKTTRQGDRRQGDKERWDVADTEPTAAKPTLCLWWTAACGSLSPCLLVSCLSAGCQQEMARQPGYRPLEPSEFFADGRRPGRWCRAPSPAADLGEDRLLLPARAAAATDRVVAAALVGAGTLGTGAAAPLAQGSSDIYGILDYADRFPSRSPRKCWSAAGSASTSTAPSATIRAAPATARSCSAATRGRRRTSPTSRAASSGAAFKILLRDAPVGYYFEVVTQGLRGHARLRRAGPAARPLGDHRLHPRAQLSQYAPLDDLPPEEQQTALRSPGGQP